MILLAVALISLQSLYSLQLGMPLYATGGTIILACCAMLNIGTTSGPAHNNKMFNPLIAGPFALFAISAIAFLFNGDILVSRLAALALIASIPISYSILSRSIDPIELVRKLLVLHISVFYVQFILYYGFRIDFDPVAILSDNVQSGWGGSLNHSVLGEFRRLGGMYNEPGTYATFIAPLVALLYASQKSKQGQGNADIVILLLSLISLILTFSVFAWLFCIIIACVTLFTSFRKSFYILPLVPFAAWLAYPYIVYRFYDNSSHGIDDGVGFRQEIWDNIQIFTMESASNFLWGYGFLNEKVPFRYSGAINDVGLLPYSLLYGGVLGTLLILSITVRSGWRLGLSGVAIYSILLSSKISIFAPMFWLTLALTLHVGAVYGKGTNDISNNGKSI